MAYEGDKVVFRLMKEADIPGILRIETSSFSVPWTKKAFADELENDLAHYLVAEIDGAVVAYAGAWIIFDEAHITNVAVLPERRGQSLGEKIMREMIAYTAGRDVVSMTLEVRPSNTAAVRLYEKLGFVRAGVRKGYYSAPAEDAVIMWLKDMAGL